MNIKKTNKIDFSECDDELFKKYKEAFSKEDAKRQRIKQAHLDNKFQDALDAAKKIAKPTEVKITINVPTKIRIYLDVDQEDYCGWSVEEDLYKDTNDIIESCIDKNEKVKRANNKIKNYIKRLDKIAEKYEMDSYDLLERFFL